MAAERCFCKHFPTLRGPKSFRHRSDKSMLGSRASSTHYRALTSLWKRIGGGWHLYRPIGTVNEGAGFEFERLATGYMRPR